MSDLGLSHVLTDHEPDMQHMTMEYSSAKHKDCCFTLVVFAQSSTHKVNFIFIFWCCLSHDNLQHRHLVVQLDSINKRAL